MILKEIWNNLNQTVTFQALLNSSALEDVLDDILGQIDLTKFMETNFTQLSQQVSKYRVKDNCFFQKTPSLIFFQEIVQCSLKIDQKVKLEESILNKS